MRESKRSTVAEKNCSIARTVAVVGDTWTLLVLREAFMGVRRFDQMQRDLEIARNVLADRLHGLVANGVLDRVQYQERPPRHEYRLTQKGRDLYPALVALMQWGDRYACDAGPPVTLVHRSCEHHTEPYLACSHCGEALEARDVRAQPGPGLVAST
jgi:DNA-binding HxlR family transcriptional regulator